MIGEAWSTIKGSGSAFSDPSNPQVVVRVGPPGSTGKVEISDMLFQTAGPAGGAIIMEWNVHDPRGSQGVAGMWDSIIALAGRRERASRCPPALLRSYTDNCMGAFLGLHITKKASAYIEVGETAISLRCPSV